MTNVEEAMDGAAAEAAAIDRLSRLDPLAYDRVRLQEADNLGVRVGTLDKQVGQRRQEEPEAGAGRALDWPEPEPWPAPVDGAELLDELAGTFRRFLVLQPGCDTALALWVLHAHAFGASFITPRLAITSPEMRCGKSTVLKIVRALTPKPMLASNITAAALFRTIELVRPTLLVDEADSFLPENEELRGILNAGHDRTGEVIRVVGDDHEPRRFSTWAPVAIAAIGKLPSTLADRSVAIPMKRKAAGEPVERWRGDRDHLLADLVRRCTRWAADHMGRLRDADPDVPVQLNDRSADNWRPLLVIADAAGGTWPERARRAALTLSGGNENQGLSAVMLSDLRAIFAAAGNPSWLATKTIIENLVSMEERPWGTISRGKPINGQKLSALLKPYGIYSSENVTKTANGYRCDAFRDAWNRYLPPAAENGTDDPPIHPKPSNGAGFGPNAIHPDDGGPGWIDGGVEASGGAASGWMGGSNHRDTDTGEEIEL